MSTMNIVIRQLDVSDLNEYRNIRLELLKKEPKSFGSSFDEESRFPDDMWISRLSKEHINIFGSFHNDKMIGIAVVAMNPRKKIKHVATLNSMYIKEEYRSNGIGRAIIEEALDFLRKKDVEIVNLSVVSTNLPAINLYHNLGFKLYGEEKKGIKLDNKYIDMFLMSKEL